MSKIIMTSSYQVVKRILEEDVLARDSDNRLLVRMLQHEGATIEDGVLSIKVGKVMNMQPFSTHTRSRRLIQRTHKDLRPSLGVQFARAERMGKKGLHILDELMADIRLQSIKKENRGTRILNSLMETLKSFRKG